MTTSERTRVSRLFEHAPYGASVVAIVVGSLVLLGWALDLAPLKSGFSGLVAMKANTAAGFILAGVSLWTASLPRAPGRPPPAVARFCGGGVTLLGLLVLAEYLTGADFGIDQLLFLDITELPGDIPGRMAVSTAACFAALGTALALLSREQGGTVQTAAVHALAIVPILVAGAALVSYGYDIQAFLRARLNYTPMALNTAAVFVALGLGVVSARPEFPFRRILTSDGAAGGTARLLLPAAVGLQLVMGWLLLRGLKAGYLNEAASLALFAVANIGGLGALIQWNAVRLDRADARRRLAEKALHKSAEEIEDLYNRAPIGYHSVDKDGAFVRINDTELAWLGYTREEVVGRMNFADLLSPESRKTFRETFAESKARGRVHDLEYDMLRKDGSILPVLLSATAVRDAQGNFVMSRSTVYDNTERKQNETLNAIRLHLVRYALTHSLDELLEETLNETERLTGSLIGFYHFVEEDQNALTLQAWSTRTKTQFCKAEGKGMHYPIAEAGVWADCARQGKPVIHNDYAALPNRKGMPEGHAEVVRELVVPVHRGDKLSALLGVGNKPANYTEKDVEAVLMIADLTGEIAARKRAEEALRESEERYRSVIAALFEGVILMDADGAIRASNASAERILGIPAGEMAAWAALESRWHAIHEDGSPFPGGTQPVWLTLQTGEPCHDIIMGIHKPDGTLAWISLNSRALCLPGDAQPYAVVTSFADITERKRAEHELRALQAQLREQAIRDPLTGLYNRRYLDETLRRELARAARDGYPLSLLMLDVDRFKRLNDTHGHPAGDEVLRLLGGLLQQHARISDIPCRYGGEEFVLVLLDVSPEVARERAERMRRDFADLRIAFGGAEIQATLSIGVSSYPDHGQTAGELIRAADLALYDAKQSGRNRVCYAGASSH